MSAPKILIVEDNPTTRKLYRLILQAEGYDVVEAGDAQTALQRVAQATPDLILQDLLLPDLNGVELLSRLRALPEGPALRIVGVSGFRTILEETRASPLGFDATLVKPVDRVQLLSTIESLLPLRASRPDPLGHGRRVLVIDDDVAQLKLVRLRLLDAGFDVTSATDAEAGLALALADPPALVLCDVLMSGKDGFELCAAVRREPALAAVPVVLMSAYFVDAPDTAFARRVGAASLVPRSPDLREVIEAVAGELNRDPTSRAPLSSFPEADHNVLLTQRLKHLASVNAALVQRCANQAAQLSIVGGVADALSRSQDIDAVLADVLVTCLDAAGISKGALFREDTPKAPLPDQSLGLTDEQRLALAALVQLSLEPLIAAGRPVALSALLSATALSTFNASADVTSAVLAPIMVDGRCRAVLFLACGEAELNDEELVSFARAISAYVAQAFMLSLAFGRLSATAELDRALFGSLETDKILHSLAALLLQRMADVCELDLVEPDGSLRSALVAHADPTKRELVLQLNERFPPFGDGSPRRHVLATRCSQIVAELSQATRAEGSQSAEHLELLNAIGLRSTMTVAVALPGQIFGVLTLGSSRPGRRYGSMDLALAEEVAARAAVALQHAQLYDRMHQASRLKDEFLATVSHELRTPLNAMFGWSRMLRSGKLTDEKREHALATIERSAVAQAQLIEDILDISRIVSGKLVLHLDNVSFASVVERAFDAVRWSLEARQLTFEAVLESSNEVNGDAERLKQVVCNLLSNAVKFTPPGGTVSARLEETDQHLVLTVKDSGKGIAREFLPRVFERFQQADGTSTRVHGGLGLGLSIAKSIVELHGGTIQAHSDGEGCGAAFQVALPRSAKERIAPPTSASDTPRLQATPPELAGLRVLVVDDDDDARELLTAVLAACHAEVTAARSAGEAIAQLSRSQQDVMVSDIGMPHEDGVSLIRAIRAMPVDQGGRIPAIAVTGYARPEDRSAVLGAGYQLHLAKPYEPEEMIERVASLARIALARGHGP